MKQYPKISLVLLSSLLLWACPGDTDDNEGNDQVDHLEKIAALEACHTRIRSIQMTCETTYAEALNPKEAEAGVGVPLECGSTLVSVESYNDERGWLYLSWEKDGGTYYSHRMEMNEDRKAARNILFLNDDPATFLRVRSCDVSRCQVECWTIPDSPVCQEYQR